MGMDESSSLKICPDSQSFFVIPWDGRTPFSIVTSGVPPKEEFQSQAMGTTEGTTRTMVQNWGRGAWHAQYAISSSCH